MTTTILDNVELKIIQHHLESVSGNVLLCSNDSKTIDLISSENLQVLSNSDKTISDHIDNLLLTNAICISKGADIVVKSSFIFALSKSLLACSNWIFNNSI